MRYYEIFILFFTSGYIIGYFNIELPWWALIAIGIIVSLLLLDGFFFRNDNGDTFEVPEDYNPIPIYVMITFLYNPFFTFLHYKYNMPIYGMVESDFTDFNYMFGRALGAFIFVAPIGLLTLVFKPDWSNWGGPKNKWETYWLFTMVLAIIIGTLVISGNSF